MEQLFLYPADTIIKLDLSVHGFSRLVQFLGQMDLKILISLVPNPLSKLVYGCIADTNDLAKFSNGQVDYLLRMGEYV